MQTPWRGILVVVGAFLIHLTLGTVNTDGNLGPYLVSYMRLHGDPSITSSVIVWITATQMAVQGLLMSPSGIAAKRVGSRPIVLLGSILMSSGTAVSYFTCQCTFGAFLTTYGILFGCGVGIAYITVLTTATQWFPKSRGIVNGIVVGGFGLGSCVFNQVQTAFINPDNLPPNDSGYFTEDEVLNRVPEVFLLMGGTYFAMQLIGLILIAQPAKDEKEDQSASSDLKPLQVLKRREFYMLFFTMFFNVMIVTFFNSMYKAYGQLFISDDHFLALIGSLGSVVNAIGRISWGILADFYGYKVCMMCMCTAVAFFAFSMPLSNFLAVKSFYTVWCFGLYMSFAGTYALMPTVTAKKFGPKYVSTNYGMIFANCVISSPLTAAITQTLLDNVGYDGMFLILGAMSCISMTLTYFFKENNEVNSSKTSNTDTPKVSEEANSKSSSTIDSVPNNNA